MTNIVGHFAELAAGGVDVVAAGFAEMGDDAVGAEEVDECGEARVRRREIGDAGESGADRVAGNDVDVGAKAFHETGEHGSLLVGVVYAVDDAVFDVGDAACGRLESPGGGHDVGDAKSAV